MTSLNISPGGVPSVIRLPSSKSYGNRALILAALKPSSVILRNLPKATDVTFMLEALKKLGLDIKVADSEIQIQNSFPLCEKAQGAEIEVGEGGTTGRFLASMLLLGSAPYTLILGDGLKQRPWDEFIKLAQDLGAKASLQDNKLLIQGPIKTLEELEVDCTRTTQFASGLQLALAYLPTVVVPQKMSSSESYWEMTKQMTRHFKQNDEYEIPLDWSSASYPLAFGALKQEVFFPGLFPDRFQADSKFFDLLEKLEAVERLPGGIKVHPTNFNGSLGIEVSDCLDLVPTLAFFLSHMAGRHELKGIENLVFKESNRLQQTLDLLNKVGVKAQCDQHSLWIEGRSPLNFGAIDLVLPEDHRMVMAGALFLRAHQGGTITSADAVSKSYPEFFGLFAV